MLSDDEQNGQREREERVPLAGLFHLFVVYVVWGSTYLAIRVAVRDGAGFPPFLLGATRTLAAALLLVGWTALRRGRLRSTRREASVIVISGLLMWIGGNGLVNWAERHADSGYAALLVGTTPMWIALFEALVDRRAPSLRLAGAILLGFLGLFVLTWPVLRAGGTADLWSVVALILAPFWWGIGLVLQSRRPGTLAPATSAGYQQLAGAAGLFLVAFMAGEPSPQPVAEAWIAWGYLVLAGSVLAFTSFLRALRLLPARLVATYSYVNPVIAVLLGWLVLGERITGWTLAGTALILAGIWGTFRARPPGGGAPRLPERTSGLNLRSSGIRLPSSRVASSNRAWRS